MIYKEVVYVRKPAKLPLKILLFGLFALLLAVWYWLDLPCIPRYITGFICPGCGMSRAWLSVLQLDFAAAFRYHPLFWCVPILAVYILYDGEPIQNRKVNYWVLGLLLAALLVCYLMRLSVFLNGELTI